MDPLTGTLGVPPTGCRRQLARWAIQGDAARNGSRGIERPARGSIAPAGYGGTTGLPFSVGPVVGDQGKRLNHSAASPAPDTISSSAAAANHWVTSWSCVV
jgi:hypothetical protein